MLTLLPVGKRPVPHTNIGPQVLLLSDSDNGGWSCVSPFRDGSVAGHSSGPASAANYHQSRGLIKV